MIDVFTIELIVPTFKLICLDIHITYHNNFYVHIFIRKFSSDFTRQLKIKTKHK